MWFFKRKIKSNLVTPLSEYEALEELIQRLEMTPRLSKEEENKRYKKFANSVTHRMINEGVTRGVAAVDHQMYNQSEEGFKAHLKTTDNDLNEQISIFNFGLDRWFEHGETHPPYFPWRIAIILSKRKELEKEKRFLAAYCGHFKYRVGKRDQEITNRAIKKGAISCDGIPSEEEVLSIAGSLIRKHGLNARAVADEMRTRAYSSGSEIEFLQKHLVWEAVIQSKWPD